MLLLLNFKLFLALVYRKGINQDKSRTHPRSSTHLIFKNADLSDRHLGEFNIGRLFLGSAKSRSGIGEPKKEKNQS